MANPSVFVSSTYYDLKHLRSAIDTFIAGLGYEAVLSEKGDIAYAPDAPLDESCYRAAEQADIFVLIIGGRYGSAASTESGELPEGFFDRYDSITKKEYDAAESANVPTYILIERGVHAEYQTFRRNRDRTDIVYAHVDSINIFQLIEEILEKPRNNPVFQFDRYQEIEEWLRNQWAGLFKDLLSRLSEQEQLTSLASQVAQLGESNKTLRRYLEEVISSVSPDTSKSLIDEESKRLDETKALLELRHNDLVDFAISSSKLDISEIRDFLMEENSATSFLSKLVPYMNDNAKQLLEEILESRDTYVLNHINQARKLLDLPHVDWNSPSRKKRAKKRAKK